MKQPRFLNRIQRRWPRPIRSRVLLAKLDFNFVLAVDRMESEAGHSTPGGAIQIAREASITLEQCNVPQSEWEARHAQN
jgi:hypothetical protein